MLIQRWYQRALTKSLLPIPDNGLSTQNDRDPLTEPSTVLEVPPYAVLSEVITERPLTIEALPIRTLELWTGILTVVERLLEQ